jgi:molybdopterin-guanine dinucleotide biosynthesis protein A
MDSLLSDCAPTSVLLLAGGQGARVGGADKGLLPWRGLPMIEHLHAQVRPLTDDLIISCNRNADRYALYADQLALDSEPGYPGPMAGLRAGLSLARHRRVLVLPCDVPGIDGALLSCMLARHAQHPDLPLIIRQGGVWEPLLCVLPSTARGAFEAAWACGERSPRRVLLGLRPQALDCLADDPRLRNLNTLELMQSNATPGAPAG